MSGNYKAPIVHGTSVTGETPTKCMKCAHRIQTEDGRWICENHPQGKFAARIAYSCFKYK